MFLLNISIYLSTRRHIPKNKSRYQQFNTLRASDLTQVNVRLIFQLAYVVVRYSFSELYQKVVR
jgi:hypothetical protein